MARILIVDDDAATRDLLRRALESDGHSVATAPDGGEAIDLLASGPGVDLLVTDVQMPGVDGIKLAREALDRNPALRVVMMSGFADQLERAKGLGAGTVHTLSKPFTLEKARAEVKAALA